MRIAYICYWNMASEDGVTKKILGQVAHWRARGHEVEIFSLEPGPLRPRWSGTQRLVRDVEAFAPDVVYLRFDLYLPPLRRLLRRFPTVFELNTDDRAELALRPLHARLYNGLNRRLFLGLAAGFVAVTEALAAQIRPRGKPVAVIGNGVDLEAFPALAPPGNARPRLLYVGSADQRWQGLDKLTALAVAEPGWDFDVVGPSQDELPDRPPNVTVHGFLTRDAYEPIVARAEVAVGPLALHRKRMDEACPLKLREYLAYGLPTVIGYRDTDFPGAEPWFLLRVQNVEDNVAGELPRIHAFVEEVRGRRVDRASVAHLAAGAKEETRLRFLESVLGP